MPSAITAAKRPPLQGRFFLLQERPAFFVTNQPKDTDLDLKTWATLLLRAQQADLWDVVLPNSCTQERFGAKKLAALATKLHLRLLRSVEVRLLDLVRQDQLRLGSPDIPVVGIIDLKELLRGQADHLNGIAREGSPAILRPILQSPLTDLPSALETLKALRDRLDDPAWLDLGGLPRCLLSDSDEALAAFGTQDNDLVVDESQERRWGVDCRECTRRVRCMGLSAKLSTHAAALRPHKTTRANSFVYEPSQKAPLPDHAPCPLLDDEQALNLGLRDLWLAHQGELHHLRTDSSDFDPDEIRVIRDDLSQVYLVSDASTHLSDFATQLEKLVRRMRFPSNGNGEEGASCVTCPKLSTCPGIWEASPDNGFLDAEDDLADTLRSVRGRVLDVGGGPLRYPEMLRRMIDQEWIDYQVVEPSPPESLRYFLQSVHHPEALFEAPFETVELEGSFDWIWFLRSYNHLEQLAGCLQKAKRLLAPKGKLLLADNTAFGLIQLDPRWRKREQARKDAPVFEHYRNHTASQARQALRHAGFTVRELTEVGPLTANQWMILAEKS